MAMYDFTEDNVRGVKHKIDDDAPYSALKKQHTFSDDCQVTFSKGLTDFSSPPKSQEACSSSVPSEDSEDAQPLESAQSSASRDDEDSQPSELVQPSSSHDACEEASEETIPLPARLSVTPFGKLLIVEDFEVLAGRKKRNKNTPYKIVRRSMDMCQVPYRIEIKGSSLTSRATLIAAGIPVSDGEAGSKKLAREVCCESALEKLREICFTVRVKHRFLIGPAVAKSVIEGRPEDDDDVDVPSGMHKQTMQRSRFGTTQGCSEATFRENILYYLRQYANGDSDENLVFTGDFTQKEKKLVNQLAKSCKLKSITYAKEVLLVWKKVPLWDEVNKILAGGGHSEKYDLIPPRPAPK